MTLLTKLKLFLNKLGVIKDCNFNPYVAQLNEHTLVSLNSVIDKDKVKNIYQILDRIEDNPDVSNDMLLFAYRLVVVYLPAIELNYHACIGVSSDITNRINRNLTDIHHEILGQIEDLLIDIEHGAVFKDNLYTHHLKLLLELEQSLNNYPDIQN